MNDLSSTVAVYSQGGALIHLHIDGFRTQKTRHGDEDRYPTTVCGVSANTFWPGFPPQIPGRPTGRVWVPLLEAIALERYPRPEMQDPRYPIPSQRRFCAKCIGMALDWAGRLDTAIDVLATRITNGDPS